MIKLNFDQKFHQLDGTDLCDDIEGKSPIVMHKVIAHRLQSETKPFDAMKFYDWSQLVYKDKSLEIDAADFKKLREWVAANESLAVILRGPILKQMDADEKFSIEPKKDLK